MVPFDPDISAHRGVLEKRQHERIQVALQATYQLLTEDKAKEVLFHPDFLNHPEQHVGSLFSAGSSDLSMGGMALVAVEPIRKGSKVLVTFEVPATQTPLTCLAEVRWVQQFEEMKRPMFRAGLRFLSLRREDVLKLADFLKGRGSQ